MLRGYRGIVGAVVGIALLGATSPPQNLSQPNQEASQSASKADIARIATALERLPQAEDPDSGCEQGRDDRKSDLCAQWKAADAAYESAYWARRTFWLGIVGAMIGLFTLGAAGTAAWWARSAAHETAKGSTAAENSLIEARRVNQALVRPYLYFTETTDEPARFERGSKIKFAFQNFGNTPALNVRIQVASDLVDRPIGPHVVSFHGIAGSYGDIAPGRKQTDSLTVDCPISSIADIARGQVMLTRLRLLYDLPSGGNDEHDITMVLDNDGLATSNYSLISDIERQRGPN